MYHSIATAIKAFLHQSLLHATGSVGLKNRFQGMTVIRTPVPNQGPSLDCAYHVMANLDMLLHRYADLGWQSRWQHVIAMS